MESAHLAKPIDVDARWEPRTSLFVMAALYNDSGSSPVKVRDLSSRGALIEGEGIGPPEQAIRLCRGSLSVIGRIVWSRGGRAGLQFDSTVSVTEWLPARATPQQHVDEVVQQVKGSGTVTSRSLGNPPRLRSAVVSAAEVTRVRMALESLAEDLSADPEVVNRHMAKLQTLDQAAKLLRKLADER